RGGPVVARVQAVLAADVDEDRVGLGEDAAALDLEDREDAVGGALLERGPLVLLDPRVLERDAGEVEGEPALLAAAAGEVEVAELGHGRQGTREAERSDRR